MTSPSSASPPWIASYPPGIDWAAPLPSAPVPALLTDAVRVFPDNRFLEFLGRWWTYREAGDLVDRLALGLQQLGVRQGQRVGLFLPNTPYYVIAYYAILKIGAVVVNLNPLYTERELTHHLNDSDTDIIFTLDLVRLYEKVRGLVGKTTLKRLVMCSLAKALPFPKNLIFPVLRGRELCRWSRDTIHIAWEDLLAPQGGVPEPVPIAPHHDPAVLQYTGGTTGVSKGAVLTHANVYANAVQTALWFEGAVPGRERVLAVIPLFHAFAMTAAMNMAIRLAASIILLPKFSEVGTMETIQRLRPTLLPAVPSLFTALLNHPKRARFDLSSLKRCVSGGAPLPVAIKAQFEEATGCKLVEGYGLSEASPVLCCNPVFGVNKPGSIGLPLPNTAISVRDLTDPTREVPLGERGEICGKGPQVMRGYWNRPDETAQVMLPDGWLRTGDIGHMDRDGYVFVTDRLKDLILCNGYNVYPRTVEEIIYLHPAVAETIVIGVPDPVRGQAVKAFVALKPGHMLTEPDLQAFLKDKLSPLERPRVITFREALPKTLLGKPSRKALLAEELGAEPEHGEGV